MSTGQLGVLTDRAWELARAGRLDHEHAMALRRLVAEAYEQGYVDAGRKLPLADDDSETQADAAGRRAQFTTPVIGTGIHARIEQFTLPLPGDPE
jgi:hypothetical protein